ncbi:MAG TPA: BMP family ABC transporter substrate-binding protein [Conexibacter sp.]|nr:BMP family ABC transporter substrate-binding protein [Conexibacter sp.]
MLEVLKRAPLAALLVGAVVAAGCGSSSNGSSTGGGSSSSSGGGGARIAIVETGPKDDGGWNSNYLRGANALARLVPGSSVTFVADVNPGAQAQQTMGTLATQGYDAVVSNGNFAADVSAVAPRYPKTKFYSSYDARTAPNKSVYQAGDELGGYVDGVIAGSMTRSGILGYVGSYGLPGTLRTVNAFELGAKSVRPDVVVKRLDVNSYYDPTKEQQAAEALVDAGADVLLQNNTSPASATVAEKRGVGYVGWNSDLRRVAPNAWLGGFTYDWAPYLAQIARGVKSADWRATVDHPQDVTSFLPYGSRLPAAVKAKAERARKELESGQLKIFTGPITDNRGRVVVAKGQTISTPDQLNSCCTWLVQGVQGG